MNNDVLAAVLASGFVLNLFFYYHMIKSQEEARLWKKSAKEAVEAMKRMSDRL